MPKPESHEPTDHEAVHVVPQADVPGAGFVYRGQEPEGVDLPEDAGRNALAGRSALSLMHQTGYALDFSSLKLRAADYETVRGLAESYGLLTVDSADSTYEPWHIEELRTEDQAARPFDEQ